MKPFWQNYFSYMSSLAPKQLQGHLALEEAQQRCSKESRVTLDGEQIFPCGLMATSVFNDSFLVSDLSIDTESEHMPVWHRFKNPPEHLALLSFYCQNMAKPAKAI